MSAVTADELHDRFAKAIRAGDLDAVVDAVEATPATLRKALSRWMGGNDGYRELTEGATGDAGHPVHLALHVAHVGVAGSPREAAGAVGGATVYLPREGGVSLPGGAVRLGDLLFELVKGRGRVWLSGFASALVTSERFGPAFRWRLAHRLVCCELADRPSAPEYVLRLLWSYPWAEIPREAAKDERLAALVGELLRTPGVGHYLGGWDSSLVPGGPVSDEIGEKLRERRERGWRELRTIVGGDDPQRRPGAIDECLAGLAGGLPLGDAPGLAATLDALDVMLDEAVPRQARYAILLVGDAPTAVQAGNAQLRRLLEGGGLEADVVLGVTPDVLLRKEKARVRTHLKLLSDAVAAGVLDQSACTSMVAESIDPARTDLAVEAARLVARWSKNLPPDQIADVRSRLSQAVPEPWPALRRALGPLAPDEAPAAMPDEVAPTPVAPAPVDLPEPGRVDPVASFDELLALVEEVLPLRPSALDVERALDGMNRFRDPAGHVGEVRVERLLTAVSHSNLQRDVALVVQAWCGRETPGMRACDRREGSCFTEAEVPTGAIISRWFDDGLHRGVLWYQDLPAWHPDFLIYCRLARVRLAHFASPPAPLLSLPIFDDGTISADAFIERVYRRSQTGVGSEEHDLGTALLRIRPQEHDALLSSGVLRPEAAELLALLSREVSWTLTPVELPDRSRSGTTPAERWLDPDAPRGSKDDPVRAWLDTRTVLDQRLVWRGELDLDTERRGYRRHPRPAAMAALTLPSHLNLLAAHFQAGTTWGALDVLAGSRGPWGMPVAAFALRYMYSDDAATRLRIAEVLARAARHGLLSAPTLGTALELIANPARGSRGKDSFGWDIPWHLNRVAAVLTDASRIDDIAARVVLDALVPQLSWLHAVKGGHEIVGLAAATAERLRVRVEAPPEVVALAAGRSSSKTAAEARRLVAAGR